MREEELDLAGACIGIGFEDIEKEGDKKLIRIYIEDDENWHKTDVSLNRFWIDDFVETLLRAKEVQDSVFVKNASIDEIIFSLKNINRSKDEMIFDAIEMLEQLKKG